MNAKRRKPKQLMTFLHRCLAVVLALSLMSPTVALAAQTAQNLAEQGAVEEYVPETAGPASSSDAEKETGKETGNETTESTASTASSSDALYDEDGFLLDGEVMDDVTVQEEVQADVVQSDVVQVDVGLTMTSAPNEEDIIATLNDQDYTDISEAVAAAAMEGGILYLQDDIGEQILIPEGGQEFTLDLSGHSVSYDSDSTDEPAIRVEGSVVIEDSLGGGSVSGSQGALSNYGSTVINAGFYEDEVRNVSGTLEIRGGTFSTDISADGYLAEGCVCVEQEDGTWKVEEAAVSLRAASVCTVTYVSTTALLDDGSGTYSNTVTREFTPGSSLDWYPGFHGNYWYQGWYLDEEFTEPVSWDITIDEDITLYLKAEAYTYVTFDTNGGHFSDETTSYTENYPLNTPIGAVGWPPEVIGPEGYYFLGWSETQYTSPDPENPDLVDLNTTYPGDGLTLYAVWTTSFVTVTYVGNTALLDDGNGNYSNTVTRNFVPGGSLNWFPSTVGHYWDQGWYLDEEFMQPVNWGMTVNEDITIYLQAVEYTIVQFEANGGLFTNVVDTNTSYFPSIPLTASLSYPGSYLDVSSPEGYYLLGWSTTQYTAPDPENPELIDLDTTYPSEGLVLYAVWTTSFYTVTYVSSTALLDDGTGNYSNTVTRTIAPGGRLEWFPSAVGHYWEQGWYLDEGFMMPADAGMTVNADTTIYLNAEAYVEVTFDANGGYFTDGYESPYSSNYSLNNPSPLSAYWFPGINSSEGYSFLGWSTIQYSGPDPENPELVDLYTTYPSEGLTLYAVWTTSSVTVTYVSNTAMLDDGYGNYSNTVTKGFASGCALNWFPNLVGQYWSMGWYLDEAFTQPADSGMTVNEDITLYLQTEAYCTVYFDTNGGYIPGINYNPYDVSYSYTDFLSTRSSPEVVHPEGYYLLGWSTTQYTTPDPENPELVDMNATQPSDGLTLYAVWTTSSVTVTYVSSTALLDDGTGNYSNTVTRNIGPGSSLYWFPSFTGQYWDRGWYLDEAFTQPVYYGMIVNEDITIYLRTEAYCDVWFDANGGYYMEGYENPCSLTRSLEYPLSGDWTPVPASMEGYYFLGWSLTQYSEPDPENLELVDLNTTYPSEGLTLYAVWTTSSVTVTYVSSTALLDDGYGNYSNTVTRSFAPGGSLDWFPAVVGNYRTDWYLDEGFSQYAYAGMIVNEDITIYLRAEECITVQFEANGGYFTNVIDTDTSYFPVIPLNEPLSFAGSYLPVSSPEGYYCLGWSTTQYTSPDPENPDLVDLNTTYPSEGLVLYAVWTTASYTVTYISSTVPMDDGTGNYSNTVTRNFAPGANLDWFPSVPGNYWTSWYLDDAFTQYVEWDATVNEDITVYLRAIAYTVVTYDANGGEFKYGLGNITTTQCSSDHPIYWYGVPEAESPDGYCFLGWSTTQYTSPDPENPELVDVYNLYPYEGLTLYAVWTANVVTVRFVAPRELLYFYYDGMYYDELEIRMPAGKAITSWPNVNFDGSFGYTTGWYTDEALTQKYEQNGNTPVTSDLTLYLGVADYITLTGDANGGYFNQGEEIVTIRKIIDPEVMESPNDWHYGTAFKEGMAFAGWFYDAACTQPVEWPLTISESMTIYAGYTADNTVNVTLISDQDLLRKPGSAGESYLHQVNAKVVSGSTVRSLRYYRTNDGTHYFHWYADEALTERVEEETVITADTTLYLSGLRSDIRVSIDFNGGNAFTRSAGYFDAAEFTNSFKEEKIYTAEDFLSAHVDLFGNGWDYSRLKELFLYKNGYAFDQWYLNGKPLSDTITLEDDADLKAGWCKGNEITLDLDGGQFDHEFPLQFWVKDGDQLPNILGAFDNERGVCIGWRLPDGTVLSPRGEGYYPRSSTTLTAVYGTPEMITFRLHNTDPSRPMAYNGVETTVAEISVRSGYTLADALHSEGGVTGEFDGWTLVEGSTDFVSEERQFFTQDTDFYTVYDSERGNIVFDYADTDIEMGGYFGFDVYTGYQTHAVTSAEFQYRIGTNGEWRSLREDFSGSVDQFEEEKQSGNYWCGITLRADDLAFDGMYIRMVVTDNNGTHTSEVLQLNMEKRAAFTSQPASVTASEGESVSFTVGTMGDVTSYQWFMRENSEGDWIAMSQEDAATETITVEASGNGTFHGGTQYQCVIQDNLGNTYVSQAATLRMEGEGPYTVSFEVLEGYGSFIPVTVQNGQSFFDAENWPRDLINDQYYIWYTDAEDRSEENKITTDRVAELTGDITLYGVYARRGWAEANDGNGELAWYYFDGDAFMVINRWKKYNGNYYFLGEDGVMLTDGTAPGGQQIGSSGAYLKPDGSPADTDYVHSALQPISRVEIDVDENAYGVEILTEHVGSFGKNFYVNNNGEQRVFLALYAEDGYYFTDPTEIYITTNGQSYSKNSESDLGFRADFAYEAVQGSYTVTFDIDGDTSVVDPVTVTNGSTFFSAEDWPADIIDEQFYLWYTDLDDENTKINEDTVAELTGDITVYGKPYTAGWLTIERNGVPCRYYFNDKGNMMKNRWKKLDGNLYWFGEDGIMRTDQGIGGQPLDPNEGYYVDNDGNAATTDYITSSLTPIQDIYLSVLEDDSVVIENSGAGEYVIDYFHGPEDGHIYARLYTLDGYYFTNPVTVHMSNSSETFTASAKDMLEMSADFDFIIDGGTPVASVNGVEYADMAEAVQAASGTMMPLTVLNSYEGQIIIPSGADVVLDVNGQEIGYMNGTAAEECTICIEEGGILTIQDGNGSGRIYGNKGTVFNRGTLKIENGNFESRVTNKGGVMTIIEGSFGDEVRNQLNGTLTIEKGFFGLVANKGGENYTGTVEINGGSFAEISTSSAGGEIVINDGKFGNVIHGSGGGDIFVHGGWYTGSSIYYEGGEGYLLLYGGDFIGVSQIGMSTEAQGSLEIKGGIFGSDMTGSGFLPEGYVCTMLDDGSWQVAEDMEPAELRIVQQPVNVEVAAAGDTATFTVVAEGEGLQYSWYHKNPGQTQFFKTGAYDASYSVAVTAARDGRQMYCEITDAYGNMVTTDTVTMSIHKETVLKITQQPVSVEVAATGDTATFTVEAEGEGLQYSWYHKNPSQTQFFKTGAYESSYSLAVTAARDGRQMYCEITDAYGNMVTTDTVTMSIHKETVLKITQQPVSVEVATTGDTATFTVEAEGEGLQYSWYHKNPSQTQFFKTGAYESSYSLAVTAARDGRQMYCEITDAYGNMVTTDTVTMSIHKETVLKITQQPVSVEVATTGDTATFTVEAEGEGLQYSWYHKNPSQTQFFKTGAYSASYSIAVTAARDGRQMYCVITDATGNSVTTDTVTMSIHKDTALRITRQPESVEVSAVGETATFTVEAEGQGLQYKWYHMNPGQTQFFDSRAYEATYSLAVTSTRNGRQMYCVITDANGNSVTTDTVTMSVAAGQ